MPFPSAVATKMDDLLLKLLVLPPHPLPKTLLSDAQYDDGIRSQVNGIAKISRDKLLLPTSGGESALDVGLPEILGEEIH